jgi:hypothetical protein
LEVARNQFARVMARDGGAAGFVVLSDTGHVSFHPTSAARRAEPLMWEVLAPSVSAGKAEAYAHHGTLDWRDIPDDEHDPVGWASMRAAVARSFLD